MLKYEISEFFHEVLFDKTKMFSVALEICLTYFSLLYISADKSGKEILTFLQYKQRNSKPHWCMKLSVMGPEVSEIITLESLHIYCVESLHIIICDGV